MKGMRYAAALVQSSLKSVPVLLACLIALLCATAPALEPLSMYAYAGEQKEHYQDLFNQLQSDESSGEYASAPQQMLDYLAAERTALQDIVQAKTPQDTYRAIAAFEQVRLNETEDGYLSGADPEVYEKEVQVNARLAHLANPQRYFKTSDMPALNFVAYVFAQSSSIVWLLIPLATIFSVLGAQERRTLIGSAPMRACARRGISVAVALVLSLVLMVIAFIPGFLASAIRNGLGVMDYPVVFVQNHAVVSQSLMQTIGLELLLFVVASAFVSMVAVALHAVIGHRVAACAIVLAAILVATIPGYLDAAAQDEDFASIFALMPFPYFSFGPLTGYPGSFLLDVLSNRFMSFGKGVAVLLVWAGVLALMATLFVSVRNAIAAKRRLGAHA